ncbi:hypothetical protein AC578_4229 [Pseudocercospora eumusae]|uniref:Uncharacterized protein n=1 Tax=Pseudocercospora eumusae TaxID=321146 RepID=A0A139H378_9PEZI|nr:hypothetical protein AC578_4229 [Pseudocercospora eumusae]
MSSTIAMMLESDINALDLGVFSNHYGSNATLGQGTALSGPGNVPFALTAPSHHSSVSLIDDAITARRYERLPGLIVAPADSIKDSDDMIMRSPIPTE